MKRKVENIKCKRGKSTKTCIKKLKNTGINVSHVILFNYLWKVKQIEGIYKINKSTFVENTAAVEIDILLTTSI